MVISNSGVLDSIFDFFKLIKKFYKKLKEEKTGNFKVPSQDNIGAAFGGLVGNYSTYARRKRLPNIWSNSCSEEFIINDIFERLMNYDLIPQQEFYQKYFMEYLYDEILNYIDIENESAKELLQDLAYFKGNEAYIEYIKCVIEYSNKKDDCLYVAKIKKDKRKPNLVKLNLGSYEEKNKVCNAEITPEKQFLEDISKQDHIIKKNINMQNSNVYISNLDVCYFNEIQKLDKYIKINSKINNIASFNSLFLEEISCINCEYIKFYLEEIGCIAGDTFIFIASGLKKHIKCLKTLANKNKVTLIIIEPDPSYWGCFGDLNVEELENNNMVPTHFHCFIVSNNEVIEEYTNKARFICSGKSNVCVANNIDENLHSIILHQRISVDIMVFIGDRNNFDKFLKCKSENSERARHTLFINQSYLEMPKERDYHEEKICKFYSNENGRYLLSVYPDECFDLEEEQTDSYELTKICLMPIEKKFAVSKGKWIVYIGVSPHSHQPKNF